MKNFLKKICIKLGKDNKPIYAVVSIAIFKGIFRPTFTMMDKKSDPKEKKYAAFREGLTEVIACLTYLGVDALVKPLAKLICKKEPTKLPNVQKSLDFVGVCASALLAIPAMCNLTLKPIMDLFSKDKKKSLENQDNNVKHIDIKEQPVVVNDFNKVVKPEFKSNDLVTRVMCLQTMNVNSQVGSKVGNL